MRLLIATAALLAATAAPAQTPAPPADSGDARARLKAADANQDGKWDKPEWLAAGRRDKGFNFIDADKDGFVTPPELKAGMEKMKARRSAN